MKLRYLWDIVERVGGTFVAAFVGVYLTAFLAAAPSGQNVLESLSDFSVLAKAGVAGVAAVFTLVKTLVGARLPWALEFTGSWLSARKDPAAGSTTTAVR